MKLWCSRKKKMGSVAIRQNRVYWLTAEWQRTSWTPLQGGCRPFDSTSGPTPALIEDIWGTKSTQWGLVIPSFAHAGLFTLPPLANDELKNGIQLQLQKTFSVDSAENLFDYELLNHPPTMNVQGKAATAPNALMVAVPRGPLEFWLEWASRLRYPPVRLGPTLPALVRGIRHLPEFSKTGSALWCYRDVGGTVLLVSASGRPIGLRELGPEHASCSDPLYEPGVPRLKELLLACEDHYPELQLTHLFALGDVDSERVQSVARELQLEPQLSVDPPFDCPGDLRSDDSWVIPYGDLLEVGPHD